jgi:polyhydroxyalkanoate synthesis regulator phasin
MNKNIIIVDQINQKNYNKKSEKFKLEAMILLLKNEISTKKDIIKIQKEDIKDLKEKIKKLENQVHYICN